MQSVTSIGQSYFGNSPLDLCDMTLKENIQFFHGLIDSPTRRWNFSIPLFVFFFTFQMTMKGSKLAPLLLLVVVLEILLFARSDAIWPCCSRSRPSYPRWDNNWRQDFNVACRNSKKSFSQFLRLTYIWCYIYAYLHLLVQHTHRMNWWFDFQESQNFVFTCLVPRIKYCERTHGQNCRLLNWIRDWLMSH